MNGDLYQMPSSGAQFTRFCGGNLQSENESCVEIAPVPGSASAFIVRDTKAQGPSRELRFTGQELDNFVRGYAAQRGLTL
jgi:hypothetical protein